VENYTQKKKTIFFVLSGETDGDDEKELRDSEMMIYNYYPQTCPIVCDRYPCQQPNAATTTTTTTTTTTSMFFVFVLLFVVTYLRAKLQQSIRCGY